ncbi:hypothetical protein [Spirochaeta lutea]|uniref:DUF2007 domain-containing protein n=1 Tax=Spirochaeta lutea TaxID=1480694 RepID=A0A098R0J5_9SPIO|nr:hypothetical protein [Spirochaeta lutea]KGE73469.1 hypothetical protein DC28_03565 [Spirochaeta lutea]
MAIKRICTIADRAQAGLVSEVLNQEDIPYFLKEYEDAAYDGIFTTHFGWGHLEVPEEYAQEVRALVSQLNITPED